MDILDLAISSITFLTTREKLILRRALTDHSRLGGLDCCGVSGGSPSCDADSAGGSDSSEAKMALDGDKMGYAGDKMGHAGDKMGHAGDKMGHAGNKIGDIGTRIEKKEPVSQNFTPEEESSSHIIIRKNIDSLDKLAVLSISEVSSIVGRAVKPMGWTSRDAAVLARKSCILMERQGIMGVRIDEEDYPSQLKEIFNPPYMIFYRGNLKVLEKECVSIVGTRQVCSESAQAAFDFARDASNHDVTVVSGLANGIDSFAHRGSLASGKPDCSAAVLPCGIDTIVPTGHKKLVEQMLSHGGVLLSEYIPGCPAEPWRFVQRNRIIAALSQATLVVQAPAGSGALHTADFALECNRDLFFHSAGFCEAAEKIARDVEKRKPKGKLLNNSRKYLEEGAPVVGNYDDYVSARSQPPGTYKNKYIDQQPLLEGLD